MVNSIGEEILMAILAEHTREARDQSAEIARLTAEVEALTAARASFPSIDRAGPIVTPPESDVATEEECRDIPKCAHGVIIFGDRVTCAECDAEVTSLKLGWIRFRGKDWACPVAPHTRVDLRFVGGDELHNVNGYVWPWRCVTAYRLVTP